MTFDLEITGRFLAGLRPFPAAITTTYEGRTNGLMSLSAGSAGVVPEAPRMTISITKYNFSHDLVRDSGIFAVHLLRREPELIEGSLAILMGLGVVREETATSSHPSL